MNSHPQIMPVNLYRKAPAARIVSVNVAQHYADIAVNETLFIYGILAEVTVAEAGGTVANDSSGSVNSGFLKGGASFVPSSIFPVRPMNVVATTSARTTRVPTGPRRKMSTRITWRK